MPKILDKLRILHTADWHLGIRLGRHERRPDTTAALLSLLEHVEQTRPDIILHAGDVFHDERPPQTAIEDAVGALTAMADHAPVVLCAGNHDGHRLLRSLDRLAQEGQPQRVTIITDPTAVVVTRPDADGAPSPVAVIAAVPWLSAAAGLQAWTLDGGRHDDPDRPAHAAWAAAVTNKVISDAEKEAANLAGADGTAPVITLIHTHLAGAVAGEALREIAVSSIYAVEPGTIQRTAYCACGHIHDAQTVHGATNPRTEGAAATAVYAGSLIRTTFGEAPTPKTAELVYLEQGADTRWNVAKRDQLEMRSARKMADFHGGWPELHQRLQAGEFRNTILRAKVQSPERIYELGKKMLEIEPTILIHNLENEVENPAARDAADLNFEEIAEPAIENLYADWRRDRRGTEREADEGAVELFKTAISTTEERTPDPFGVQKLTERFTNVTKQPDGADGDAGEMREQNDAPGAEQMRR